MENTAMADGAQKTLREPRPCRRDGAAIELTSL